jgi:hypothetical protein
VYHKFVLLAGDNHWAVRDSPEEVKKTADRHGGPDKSPSTVYVMTDPAIALKEMETTQPFIFYPEMHRRIGGAPTKDK